MTAPARVLNLLHAARPEDVAPVLSLLSDAELAASLASEDCDPDLRAIPPEREALRRALLEPRPATGHLLSGLGAAHESLYLTARTPDQRVLPGGVTPYGRPQADLREQVRARVAAVLGDAPPLWYGVLAMVDVWDGSLAALLDRAEGWARAPKPPPVSSRHRRRDELFLPGVLLAMAPPAVAAAVLAYSVRWSEGLIEGLFRHAPYHPGYLDHAFGPAGSDFARQSLCAGTDMPPAVAQELVERGISVPHLTLLTARNDDLALRLRVFRGHSGPPNPWQVSNLAKTTPEQVHALLTGAETPEDLLDLLAGLRPLLRSRPAFAELRLPAYRRLARLAGPEPVWSAELDHAGALDRMHPAVRASIATGDLGPLIAAAEAVVPPGPPPPAPNQGSLTRWPLEEAVRDRLDGRPDRWRTMLRSWDEAGEWPFDHRQRATSESVRPAARDIEDLTETTNTSPPATPASTATTTPAQEDAA